MLFPWMLSVSGGQSRRPQEEDWEGQGDQGKLESASDKVQTRRI